MDTTILYYTSNREEPIFENKIIDNLIKVSHGLPIISISQQPIKLGTNISIGDKGQSYLNLFRQILIGAKKATTKYIQYAESDFLYSPDYFNFEPKEDVYLYDNIWIVYKNKDLYYRKIYSEGAQIVRRELLIERFKEFLKDKPQWFNGRLKLKGEEPFQHWRHKTPRFTGDPCVSFKTEHGVSKYTNTLKEYATELPYWGDIKELKSKYL
jgi:hypothetical protein